MSTTQDNVKAKKFIARFVTSGKVDTVSSWLRQNAKGLWALKIESVLEDLMGKTCRVKFNEREDYDLFRTRFIRQGAAS
ncbi:MAG: hypothetical protein EXR11_11460 [Rhodospirillaceae bacterium]|nr:hypothetical protein [Rhodospirillaceae bacterium]